jgi:NAD(P)-dependent dehydrogenase (short-subunit alcohol dehydrogenase family)
MSKPLEGRVAVVTGGGGGIGSEVSQELARQGAHVVVADPGVSVEGDPLDEPTAAATAERITAAGGSASSSTVSVTDRDAVSSLFAETRERYGSLDIVVNPAGIVRHPKLPDTTEDDWFAVLDVHFNGYVNVLRGALPIMTEAGYGRVVGFTSGVGLARSAGDAMAYGAAKRAVAALTWQLGPMLPDGVHVNAMSPIAATRMVRAALSAGRRGPAGLDLSGVPQPAEMAPAAAYLAGGCGHSVGARLRGRVIFSAGSELTLITPPRLLEAVRTDGVQDMATVLATVMPVVLSPAEAQQGSGGGSNPRFGDVFSVSEPPPPDAVNERTCLVVDDSTSPDLVAALGRALPPWGMRPVMAANGRPPAGFAAAEEVVAQEGPLDALVVVSGGPSASSSTEEPAWVRLVGAQSAAAGHVTLHAAWLRAVARYGRQSGRPLRVVLISVVRAEEGQPAAQAVAQLARSVNTSTLSVPLDTFSVAVNSARPPDMAAAGQLTARLLGADDALALRGAELVVGNGWLGVRSHPGPAMTVSFGGPAIPSFVDDVLER